MEAPKDIEKYEKHYNDGRFWTKVVRVAKRAGVKLVYAALLLYYVMKDPLTPQGDRLKIIGALGYFILPLDIIPDWIPVVGYTDDLAVLTWVLYEIAKNVTPQVKENAKAKLGEWFGKVDESALDGLI